jgi:phage terminase large subunit
MAGEMARARARLLRWAADPIAMVREEFQAEPDAWQATALRAVASPQTLRVALKACKGPGKTAVLAWLILWFLATRAYSKILCTSITEANLKANLWPEINKWMMRSEFFRTAFIWTKTRVSNREEPDNWFAEARSWPKQANAEQQADALAGHHADHVMAICDESGGVPDAVMVALEAIFSSCIEGKLIQAGNPTHTTGPLHRACTRDRALWEVVTITGDPDVPSRSPRISLDWARQQIASYGRENPWVMVNVLGQFPPSSINALLGAEEVEAAMHRHLPSHLYDWAQKRLGVDVARFGDDRTVGFPRQGLAAFPPFIMRNARTTDIAARVAREITTRGIELTFVDDTGHWGHGVIDNLEAAGYPVVGLNYAGKALNPRYKNRRAEFWIEGSQAIKAGAALPFLPEMIQELTEPTYTFINGVFVLEDKDQIKERLGRSPDLADAYMETYAMPDQPSGVLAALKGRSTTAQHEFNPYPDASDPPRVQHDWDPHA